MTGNPYPPTLPHPKRILVSPLRFIGDVILTVPLLRALREAYPDTRLDVVLPKSMINLFELCPYINDIIDHPGATTKLFPLIQSRKYDLVFSMRRSVSDPLVFKLAGCRRVIGYNEQRFFPPFSYRRWGWFLDDVVHFPPVDTVTPHVKIILSLLAPLGLTAQDEHLELWASEEDKLRVASLFNQVEIDAGKPLAIFHAKSASREKALTPDKFIPALKALCNSGVQVVTLGVEQDRAYYDDLACQAGVMVFNLCGKTTLRQSYAMMLKTHLLLSLDSAPIHMAAAAGVPHIIGIYGPTNEKQWAPYPYEGQFTPVFNTQITCRPCVPKVCSHNKCRVDFSAQALVHAVEHHLDQWLNPSAVHPR